ncbi:myomegalin-like [Marmota marmota marmota]|uniref:myomegalin-like n=1 Tax=Marmota marmota marmota TaxID=9994 RepID=UPI00209334C7|nr:myomegalin-like [Marmota marmota marmota]
MEPNSQIEEILRKLKQIVVRMRDFQGECVENTVVGSRPCCTQFFLSLTWIDMRLLETSKLNLDTCIELQNLPTLGGDALGGLAVKTPGCELHVLTDTMNVLKQKIMKRKQLFCKWRMACRFLVLQASELDSNDPSGMKNSLKLEGDSMDGSFANKHGRHIIGHINDYTALREQIGEGKQLVEKIQSLLRPTCNFLGLEAQSSEAPGSKCFHELRSSTCALHHTLEESALLLTMFWRATLPSFHGPGLPGKVDETMERELLDLRAQVSKQEKLLESTAEHLKSVNQQKENMEQFIVSQLTRTHDVLKTARTNLELRQRLHLTQSHSLLQIHHSLTSDL